MGTKRNKSSPKKSSYNPYGKFTGVLIPNWLKIRKEISWGAKFTFAELANFAGVNGNVFASREKLAEKLGVSIRSAQNYLNELYKNNLVMPAIRAGSTNNYRFLDHPWIHWKKKEDVFFEDVQDPALWEGYPQPVQDPAGGGVQDSTGKNTNLHTPCAETCTSPVQDPAPVILKLKLKLNQPLIRENQIVDNFYFFGAADLDPEAETLAFEEFITSYPKNPHLMNLHALRHNWVKRRKEGHLTKLILERTKGYENCCNIKNITGERGVMSINRFLGEEKHFLNDWRDEERQLKEGKEKSFGIKK
jgi:hypothetical protein